MLSHRFPRSVEAWLCVTFSQTLTFVLRPWLGAWLGSLSKLAKRKGGEQACQKNKKNNFSRCKQMHSWEARELAAALGFLEVFSLTVFQTLTIFVLRCWLASLLGVAFLIHCARFQVRVRTRARLQFLASRTFLEAQRTSAAQDFRRDMWLGGAFCHSGKRLFVGFAESVCCEKAKGQVCALTSGCGRLKTRTHCFDTHTAEILPASNTCVSACSRAYVRMCVCGSI